MPHPEGRGRYGGFTQRHPTATDSRDHCLSHPFLQLSCPCSQTRGWEGKQIQSDASLEQDSEEKGQLWLRELSISLGSGCAPAYPCTAPVPFPGLEEKPQCARWESSRGRGRQGKEPGAHFPFQCSQCRRGTGKSLFSPQTTPGKTGTVIWALRRPWGSTSAGCPSQPLRFPELPPEPLGRAGCGSRGAPASAPRSGDAPGDAAEREFGASLPGGGGTGWAGVGQGGLGSDRMGWGSLTSLQGDPRRGAPAGAARGAPQLPGSIAAAGTGPGHCTAPAETGLRRLHRLGGSEEEEEKEEGGGGERERKRE